MPSTVKRQSVAVMFTDIAGYTSIMASDEEKALSLLQDKRKILKPLIKQHDGVYVKGIGDGTLSYFDSAYKASKCAKLFQESIYDNKNMNVRVGIHVGDIVFDDGDVYGDGVNVASRLESMSPVGGICVSNTVYDELRNKKEFDGVELGLQSLKGVGRLIEIYGLKGDLLTEPKPSDYQDNQVTVHSDDEVPSIAIIPFENKGKDEDVFYAYGISADLISDVSSAGLIRVASKKQIDEAGELPQKELAKKLDVRYMANGELWRRRDMFQLSVELYDTKDKKVVWSDRWQEKWDNLPTIKTNLSDGLLKALDTTSKVERKVETTNTEAYEFYLKAKHKYEKRENTDDVEIARGLLNKAIELDGNLIVANILLGETYKHNSQYKKALNIYQIALNQASRLQQYNNISILRNKMGNLAYEQGDTKQAIILWESALELSKETGNLEATGDAYHGIAIRTSDFDERIIYYNKALEIMEKLDAKSAIAYILTNMSNDYGIKKRFKKQFQLLNQALNIRKGINDHLGISYSLSGLSNYYCMIGNYEKSKEYNNKSLTIKEKLGNKWGIINSLHNNVNIYFEMGLYDRADAYCKKSIQIAKDINNYHSLFHSYQLKAIICYQKCAYNSSIDYCKKAINIEKDIEHDDFLIINARINLANKKLGNNYDKNNFIKSILQLEEVEYYDWFIIYQLLEEISCLETAYNQVQEKASAMEEDLAQKFLSYPIPAAIVEEWEKVK